MSSRARDRSFAAPPVLAVLAVLAALGALCLSGCNVAGAKAYNLRQIHDDEGRHVRLAQTMGDFRYLVNSELSSSAVSVGSASDAQSSRIDDPLKECIEILEELGKMDGEDPRVAAVQIQIFAWLAINDPWQLSRVFSVRELGTHGERLGISVQPRDTSAKAGVQEVRDALAQLLRAVRIEMGQEEGEKGIALAQACDRIQALHVDREGALRLLRATALMERKTPPRKDEWEPLRLTVEHLERVCIRESLLLALRDEQPRPAGGSNPGWNNPRVRAAAVTACIRSFGPQALGEMLLQLDREPEPQVLIAVLREVSKHDLPTDLPGIDPATLQGLHRRWTALIVQRATQDPNGSVRVASMRALATISDEELVSLREEDWLAWLRAKAGALGGPPAEEAPAGPTAPEPSAAPPPAPPEEDGPGGEPDR